MLLNTGHLSSLFMNLEWHKFAIKFLEIDILQNTK